MCVSECVCVWMEKWSEMNSPSRYTTAVLNNNIPDIEFGHCCNRWISDHSGIQPPQMNS